MNQHRQTLEQKIQELRNTDPFAADANLDLRGLPSFLQADVEAQEDKPDPFDQNDSMHTTMTSKNGLKHFLENPDNETVRDAASLPGADPLIVQDYLDREANEVGIAFRRQVGINYVQCDENFDALVEKLCADALGYLPDMSSEDLVELIQSKGFWTVENLVIVFNALYNSGELPVYPDGTVRKLTTQALTEMQRLAAMGRVLDAVAMGLQKTFDLSPHENLDAVMLDPAKTATVSEIVLFCWKSAQPNYDYRNDNEFDQFVYSFAGQRGLTIPICQAAWASFQKEQASAFRNKALGIQPPQEPDYSAKGFDTLSDESLENLRLAVMREKGRG